MKQIVPFLLLFAFTATLLHSCKDVDMPTTAPPEEAEFVVEMRILQGQEYETETVTAGDIFSIEVTVMEKNDSIRVEGVEIELDLNDGEFNDGNSEPDVTGSDGKKIFDGLKIEKAQEYNISVTAKDIGEESTNLTIEPAEADIGRTKLVDWAENGESGSVDDEIEIKVQVNDRYGNHRKDEDDTVIVTFVKTDTNSDFKATTHEGLDDESGYHIFRHKFGDSGIYSVNIKFNENQQGQPKGTLEII